MSSPATRTRSKERLRLARLIDRLDDVIQETTDDGVVRLLEDGRIDLVEAYYATGSRLGYRDLLASVRQHEERRRRGFTLIRVPKGSKFA